MKCTACGAEITNGSRFCEFCGSQISAEMQKEQEQLIKKGCPKCGSSNITFDREKQGELKGKNGTTVVRRTIGMCKDCGHTWDSQEGAPQKQKKRTWLWVLGWIFIFPVPLTILMLRPSNKLNSKARYGIIAAAWIIYLIWMIAGNASNNENVDSNSDVHSEVESVPEKSTLESHIYDNAEIRDVMNGTRTEKLGEYAVIKTDSSLCTEDALADLYYNYFEINEFNWITVLYTDKEDNLGIYVNTAVVCVNDKFEEDQYGDYSVITTDDEILYVPSGDGITLVKMEFEEETEANSSQATNDSTSNVDPKLKDFLDSYETFMDEYCEFMETANMSDAQALLEYAELMSKYADFAAKADAYDAETMSDADSTYYIEAMARINAKLAQTANSL